MRHNVASWRGFLSRISVIYVAASSVGVVTTILTSLLIGRFNERELSLTAPIILGLMVLAAIAQAAWDRRWLRNVRQYLAEATPSRDLEEKTYRELILYPWRGAALGFLNWQICTMLYVVARVILMPEIPFYRHIFIYAIAFGAAFLNWTMHYFLLRRATFPLLETMQVDRRFGSSVYRHSLARKYFQAFGSMLLGIVIIGGMIAYGLNRNLALSNYYKNTRDLLAAAELLVYEYRFGDSFDIQSKLDVLNARLPGTIEIIDRPGEGAIDLSSIDRLRSHWLVFPVYEAELQAIPEQFRFYRKLSFGGNRGSNIVLQYTTKPKALNAELTRAALQLLGLAMFLLVLMAVSTFTTISALTRPIRVLGNTLHPNGEDFSAPPLLISDDELMTFSIGLRTMFLRLKHLFQELLQSYWSVKDERSLMQNVASAFQQRVHRDSQHIHILTNRLRDLTDHVQGFGQQLEAMEKVSDSVSQSLRLMADTVATMQNEMITIRGRVFDAKEWLAGSSDDIASGERTMTGLDRWITEATQDFDLILRRFRELLGTLEPVEITLKTYSTNVQSGCDRVHTIYLLLDNESERYKHGVDLIQRTQDRLDEVMRRFEKVESIREQIDMLSFQAAIVASQSTEFERDFRVVADEIRDLSERAAAGIQQIFTAIWALDQQGKQTIQRIANSRQALTDALESSQRAFNDAQQGLTYSKTFTEDMLDVVDVIRGESHRTETLVESLKEPFTRGAHLRQEVGRIFEFYQSVDGHVRRLDDISRTMEIRIREQHEALRLSRLNMDRIGMQIRDLISASESIVTQSRTLRSLLERLTQESRHTSERIDNTLADLRRIEEEIFRNESEVKRVSAELQNA